MRRVLYLLLLAPLAYLYLQQPSLSLYTVVSGSMEPDLPRGSLVLVEAVPPTLGEVGAYRLEAGGKTYVMVHRVVGVGDGFYVFRGDAAGWVESVPAGDVLGRVAVAVPYLGYLYLAGLANPALVALLALAAFPPSRGVSTLFPLSFATGVLAFLLPGRGLTSVVNPTVYLAYSSTTSTLLYLLERQKGPHRLISLSHIMLAVANAFSTDVRGVETWLASMPLP